MLNKVVLDSWQLAKYVSILHKHPASIKGDFGLQKELDLMVQRDLNKKVLKFENLVQLSDYLFKDNLGSNDLQEQVEALVVKRLKDRVKVDAGRVVRLVENLASYKIKNEEICETLVSFFMENLSFTEGKKNMKIEEENEQENNENIEETFEI